jgi:Na+/melibiose symporter-like transporter
MTRFAVAVVGAIAVWFVAWVALSALEPDSPWFWLILAVMFGVFLYALRWTQRQAFEDAANERRQAEFLSKVDGK